eukprot:4159823-Lingulodinium_polyedra.AAC.1
MDSSAQESADAGCSCRMWPPRSSCSRYNDMTKLRCTRAKRTLSLTTSGSILRWLILVLSWHQSTHGGLPIKR